MRNAAISTPWAKENVQVLRELESSQEFGLRISEAEKRQELYGPNTLKVEKRITPIQRILNQFKSPVVIILLGATIVSALLGEVTDSIAIAAIVRTSASESLRALTMAGTTRGSSN